MNIKVYVGNLAAGTTENDLMDLFSPYGNVANIHLAVENSHREARLSGCVTMITSEGARSAIEALNGKVMGASALTASETPMQQPAAASNAHRSPRLFSSHLH